METMITKMKATPIKAERSLRLDTKRVLTSGNAGKILPLTYVPLLREDAVRSGKMSFTFEMAETAETLLNAVNVDVKAYFVPFLAFDRFNGMDQLNRSYMGVAESEGGTPVPFFETAAFGAYGSNAVYSTLGMHATPTTQVNTAVLESYNSIVNFRRKQRSTLLTQRNRYDVTLAEAFWKHSAMKHIVPSFDEAMIDGEVPIGGAGNGQIIAPAKSYYNSTGQLADGSTANAYAPFSLTTTAHADGTNIIFDDIMAEMSGSGTRLTLSNIEMAKKTAAFARMRSAYQGLDDDYIIDLLMSGINIPEQMLQNPLLIAEQSTVFGYQKRFATDSANLDESVTTGVTQINMNIRVPRMNTGGVLMVTAEITPEQLYERTKDCFFHNSDVDYLPEFTRDYLDPEKVSVVTNEYVDVSHSDPDSTFGYAPLNHEWMRSTPNIGGKFLRPEVNTAFDEDRQRIWAVETVDPTLTEDFYLCSNMHQKVFSDTASDGFEILGLGQFQIEGNTVFGAAINEATDDYDQVLADVDQTRIDQTA